MTLSRCVKSISKLFSGIVLTKTGSASDNRTNSGKETQYGLQTNTSSPLSKRAWQAKYKLCFSPFETKIFFMLYLKSFSLSSLSQIASLNSIIPGPAVYLVNPLSIAVFPALMI